MKLKWETVVKENETVIAEGKITGPVQLHFDQSLQTEKMTN